MKIAARIAAVWLLLITGEIGNGIIRTFYLWPWLGDQPARRWATLSGSLLILFFTTLTIRWLRLPNRRAQWICGITWVVLTVAFDVLGGHYYFGRTWPEVGSDFALWRGGLLPLGLAVMGCAPVWASRWRRVATS